MCGIAGYVRLDGAPANMDALRSMTDAIAHRGPDGEGHQIDGPVALGHRRLAIIDLREIANQPMTSQSGRWTIVYNGEIYNFKEIRQDLERNGRQFKTNGDTEVLLEALDFYGEAVVSKLNGMFAFVALDRKQQQLIFARDRSGVKPLYIAQVDKCLYFGSEIKAILANPKFQQKLDVQGLAEYLTFMNFIGGSTLVKDVQLFPAGTIGHLSLIDGPTARLSKNQYWDYRFTGREHDFDEARLSEQIESAFREAVKRQLVSDVGVSSYLSGGIDSGSITAVAAAETEMIRTFTAGFDVSNATNDRHFDERAAAEVMAKAFRTQHYEVVIFPHDFERRFQPLVQQLEEPRVGQSYPNYIVAELASRFEKVVLSGTGGDELFGGYPWRYYQGLPAKNFESFIEGYFKYWRRLSKTDDELFSLLAPCRAEISNFDAKQLFLDVFPAEARRAREVDDLLNWALYFEAKTFLNGLLVVEDKISMAHSLETRVPFLDNDLVDLACRIPVRAKLRNVDQSILAHQRYRADQTAGGGAPSSEGKVILRKMMAQLVPKEVSERPKQGFSAPDESWFRKELSSFVSDRLLSRDSRLRDLVEPDAIRQVLAKHNQGENQRLLIWGMLSLQESIDFYGL